MTQFDNLQYDDFEILDELYRSNGGSVLKARHRRSNTLFVLKQRLKPSREGMEEYQRELDLLTTLKHPHLVECFGCFSSGNSNYLVIEYADQGDLAKDIGEHKQNNQGYSESELWSIFHQIVSVTKYLHDSNVVHRDIKPLNVLRFSNGKVKLADLGVSRRVSTETVFLQTFFGTPLYLAPELVESKPYTEKVDVWALGVMLYEMACLHPPFSGNNIMALMNDILHGDRQPVPPKYSPAVGRLIDRMLQQNPRARPSSVAVLDAAKEQMDKLNKLNVKADPIASDGGQLFVAPATKGDPTPAEVEAIMGVDFEIGRRMVEKKQQVQVQKPAPAPTPAPAPAPAVHATPDPAPTTREARLRRRQADYNRRLQAKRMLEQQAQAAAMKAEPTPKPKPVNPAPAQPRPAPRSHYNIFNIPSTPEETPEPVKRKIVKTFKIDRDIPIKPMTRPDQGQVRGELKPVVAGMGPQAELEMLRKLLL